MAISADPAPQRSASAELWRRFRRNHLAMAGLAIVVALVLTALASFVFAPWEAVIRQDFRSALQPPSVRHWFGTDILGRDIFLRVLYASRTSLLVGFTVVAMGMSVGTGLGLVAGYLGGWWDRTIMRLTDIMLAFPFLLLAIAMAASMGPYLHERIAVFEADYLPAFFRPITGIGAPMFTVVVSLGFATFPSYARLVRGCVLSLREEQFVDAARAIGVGRVRIMLVHILPNLMGTLLVYGTLRISTAILAESGLSFLGLGAQPPEPTWGNMLSEAKEYLVFYAWLPLFPGLAILVTVLGFNFLGDGLRDVLDPRLKDQ